MKKKNFTYYLYSILFLFSLNINGQILVIKGERSLDGVEKYLKLAAESAESPSFENIHSDDNNLLFKPYNEWKGTIEPLQNYWAKLSVKKNDSFSSKSEEWVLKFSLDFTNIEVVAVDDLGNIQKGRSGFFTPPKDRTFAPILKANIIKLAFQPNRLYTVYIKTMCKRKGDIPKFELRLIPTYDYLISLKQQKSNHSIYLGLVLMMLIYNLILYFFAKDRTFLFYSFYLVGIATYSIYNSGDLANWVTSSLFPEMPQQIFYFKLASYFSLMAYLTFVRFFLDLSKQLPFWDKLFKWLTILAIPLFLLDAYLMTTSNFGYNIPDKILIGYCGLFILSIFAIVIPLFKTKDQKAYFIILGIISMGLGLLLTVWARIQNNDFSTFYFRIGSTIEIIAFSLGLAYRQLLNEKERQQARFQLVKSKLVQEQEQKEAERLKELDSLKGRLYTNITHEFRTPLTVIMGMAEQIKGNEKSKNLIHRNSENLLQLINQMLDLAKVEDGKLKLDLVHKDIIGYLRYLTESFSSAAESKSVRLTFYAETGETLMDYDENKIRHIVHNLLSNAIKFTTHPGKISLHVKAEKVNNKPFLQIRVQDTGIGISKEDLPFIFDRFYQSDNTSTRKAGGTGIGLALTKELVNLMKGSINAKSELGKGTEILIELPINTKLSPSIVPKNQLESNPILSEINETPIPQAKKASVEPIIFDPTAKTNQPLLLIIEDNVDVLTYIQTCLSTDYNIETAVDGQKGIEKAFEIIPDIIISDIMMPEKNGFEVTEILKGDERTSHIPIILLTAKATQEDKLEGLKQGADAYLMKPFDKKELLIRLEKLVELRNLLQRHYAKVDFKKVVTTPAVINVETIFLKKLSDAILENLSEEEFSVPQLAQMLRMSQTQVYRKLKALTGQTPSQYIRATRMKKAMEFLTTTDLNISEIAYNLGYSDPNYFSRTFQQIHGQTPSSIRK